MRVSNTHKFREQHAAGYYRHRVGQKIVRGIKSILLRIDGLKIGDACKDAGSQTHHQYWYRSTGPHHPDSNGKEQFSNGHRMVL